MRCLLLFVLVCFLRAGSPPDAPVATVFSNPAMPGSISPAATTMPNGFLLSWYELWGKRGYALRYASWENAAWSPVRTVVVRDRLMHHPAKLPEVLRLPGGSLIAHWLELTGAGPWADSLYFSRSTDDGRNWSQPEIVHGDQSPCGHGLASIAVSGPHNASVFWLNDSPGGSTQLKTADIHSNGQLGGEQVLDSDTCSCCPTTVVKTAKGLLAAYRGRTPGEIRDISLVDNYAGRWSAPRLLHRDHWRITACPVNGASLSAHGRNVVIA